MTRAICFATAFALTAVAQVQQEPKIKVDSPVLTLDQTPVFRTTVVSRTVKAINYRHRSGATKVDFAGSSLMPGATGEAKVESKKGYIEIEVEFRGLAPAASKLGRENLTYVLWAVSPEGRSTNLGELLLDSEGRAKVNVTTELQAFGMLVTAEPYFAVSQPSNAVIMENIVRKDTLGRVEDMAASFELLERGQYPFRENETVLRQMSVDRGKTPLELWEARNALQIAGWTGAGKYASGEFTKAEALLRQSEEYQTRKQNRPAGMIARQAVQTAEDARLIALKRIQAEQLENERRAAADREAAERAKAAEADRQAKLEAERAARAEQDRQAAQRASVEAEIQRRLAEQNAAEAGRARMEAERLAKLEADRRAAAEQERLAAITAKQEAEAARAAAAREIEAANAAKAAALEQQRLLAAEADRAKASAAEAQRLRDQAERDKENLRQRLHAQLNAILQTTDSARGLIVNMSDVLFDTGLYSLRPAAREKLARISGIVAAHPGLHLEIEGHTDSVGSDGFNQTLSERRANTVREYLVSQGVATTDVGARGLGESMPVADNTTAAGRQRNRRVEIVVSGEMIGKKISDLRTQVDEPRAAR